ncbi:MAG: hypothetical protein JNL60_02195, partial [Bacteroidia bacterium]|nr:hypothetical protein [Bacteroidia bacterium]
AQNNAASTRNANATATIAPASSSASVSTSSSDAIQTTEPLSSAMPPPPPGYTNTLVVDYKSVYEAPTPEEEVKIAAERFNLTLDQQDIWLLAAKDRREGERKFREFDAKAGNADRDGAYRGYRTSQNAFYETIIGHLTPQQKAAFERDRLIIEERDKRLARWNQENPSAPTSSIQTTTVTVVPTTFGMDSTAIKQKNKEKGNSKKTKKKKQAVNR